MEKDLAASHWTMLTGGLLRDTAVRSDQFRTAMPCGHPRNGWRTDPLMSATLADWLNLSRGLRVISDVQAGLLTTRQIRIRRPKYATVVCLGCSVGCSSRSTNRPTIHALTVRSVDPGTLSRTRRQRRRQDRGERQHLVSRRLLSSWRWVSETILLKVFPAPERLRSAKNCSGADTRPSMVTVSWLIKAIRRLVNRWRASPALRCTSTTSGM